MYNKNDVEYIMPNEEQKHEGTWLHWPHNYGWDDRHVSRLEPSFVAMAKALHLGEKVHILVYNEDEKLRVQQLLTTEGLAVARSIDFFVIPTNDVWARDTAPVFVFKATNKNDLFATNWQFNGWGQKRLDWRTKVQYDLDNQIPQRVCSSLGIHCVDVDLINEGGSIEIDGNGTLMAKRSSIINRNRNPGLTQKQVEGYFTKYLGVSNFIWLDGAKGKDITDDHIDGTARFANNGNTIVTLPRNESYFGEYKALSQAKNLQGKPYKIVELPMTEHKVKGTHDFGVYINFYVANKVVLVPTYNDPSDDRAIAILQELYSPTGRNVIGIPATELAKNGGMIHCVTMQQPAISF